MIMCIWIQPPPVRLLLLGPRASGKTEVGRCVAKDLGIFHISFLEYLQEIILPKMKKPPLTDDDDWEPANDDNQEYQENECTLLFKVLFSENPQTMKILCPAAIQS